MKTIKLNNKLLMLVSIFATTLGVNSIAFAAFSPTASAYLFAPEAKQSLVTKRDLLEAKHKQIEFEAFGAVNGARNALMALKKMIVNMQLLC